MVARDDYYLAPDAAILHKQVSLGFVILLGDIDLISGSLYALLLHSFCIDTNLGSSATIGTSTNEKFMGNLFSLPVILLFCL